MEIKIYPTNMSEFVAIMLYLNKIGIKTVQVDKSFSRSHSKKQSMEWYELIDLFSKTNQLTTKEVHRLARLPLCYKTTHRRLNFLVEKGTLEVVKSVGGAKGSSNSYRLKRIYD